MALRFRHWQGLYLICALAVIVGLPVAAAPQEPLRIVTEPWPPLVHEESGQPDGLLWELSLAVIQDIGRSADLEFVPWKRALDLVARERRDAVLGVGRTPERETVFRYPEEPLAVSETAVFYHRDRPLDFDHLDDLQGLRIALSAGYSYSREISSASHFQRIEVADIQAGLRLLQLERVDGFIVNREVGWYEARNLGIAEQLGATREPISSGPVYLAFSRELPAELVERFGTALSAFKETPEYRQLLEGYGPPGL